MKLAFCLFKYFSYGGLQSDFMRILTLCQQRNHQIDVYTMVWEGEMPAGITCHVIPVSAKTHAQRSWQFSKTVSQIIKQKSYDVVVGFNRMAGLDVYFAADVCFAWAMDNKHSKIVRYLPRYRTYLALEKAVFCSENVPHMLFLTRLQIATYTQYYTLPSDNIHILPPGLSQFTPQRPDGRADTREAYRQKLGLDKTQILLLSVGSHFATKGIKRSLYAYAALPKARQAQTHFVIIGQGCAKPYLRLAKKLNIGSRVRFMGARSDVLPFMLAADVLLHPAYYESAGLVLLEALSASLGVITTATCGHAEHIIAANAGTVLPTLFSQKAYNQALNVALEKNDLTIWRQNALAYANKVPLCGLHEKAVQVIESLKP